jgi:hypothetical protein
MMQFGTISHILHKELGLVKKLPAEMLQGLHQAYPQALMGHLGGQHYLE